MDKKSSQIIALFLFCILFTVIFSGCINEEQKSEESKEASQPATQLDQPSILPDWKDGEYHDYYGTMELLNDFNGKYPDVPLPRNKIAWLSPRGRKRLKAFYHTVPGDSSTT
jgi:hypothetical protein